MRKQKIMTRSRYSYPLITSRLNRPFSQIMTEGGVRVCGDAVLLDLWCGFAVIFILSCGIAVLQNQAVCGN